MSRPNPYSVDLDRNPANYAPLTPLTFIEWSAAVYPDRIAVVHGARRFTWRETYAPLPPARLGARRSAGSASATRSRRCCRTPRRCTSATSACRWPARC